MNRPSPSEQPPTAYLPPPAIPQPPPVPVELWNPVHVVLLGIVFTPAWTGIIAAINGYRLRFDVLWRPVAVGALATLLCFLLPWILSLLFYGGALFLIWKLDLQPQLAVVSNSKHSKPISHAKFLTPCLVGAPLAITAFLFLLAVPLVQLLQGIDLSDVAQNISQSDKRPYRPLVGVLAAKAFGSVGGKAFLLALLGAVVGLFKWLTRKPTTPGSSG